MTKERLHYKVSPWIRVTCLLGAVVVLLWAGRQFQETQQTMDWLDRFPMDLAVEELETPPARYSTIRRSVRFLTERVFPPNTPVIEPIFHQGFAISPWNPTLWLDYSKMLLFDGRQKEAQSALETALSLNPRAPEDGLNAIQLFALMDDQEKMVELALRVATLDENALLETAKVLLLSGVSIDDISSMLITKDLKVSTAGKLGLQLLTRDEETNIELMRRLPTGTWSTVSTATDFASQLSKMKHYKAVRELLSLTGLDHPTSEGFSVRQRQKNKSYLRLAWVRQDFQFGPLRYREGNGYRIATKFELKELEQEEALLGIVSTNGLQASRNLWNIYQLPLAEGGKTVTVELKYRQVPADSYRLKLVAEATPNREASNMVSDVSGTLSVTLQTPDVGGIVTFVLEHERLNTFGRATLIIEDYNVKVSE